MLSRKESIGLAVLLALFVVFFWLLYLSIKRPTAPLREPKDSVIVQQRMKNLEKSN